MDTRWLFSFGWIVLGGMGSAAYYFYIKHYTRALPQNKIHETEINGHLKVKLNTDIIDISKFYNRSILFIGTLVASMLCTALTVGVHVYIDHPTSGPIVILTTFIFLLIFSPLSAVAFPIGPIITIEQLTKTKFTYDPYFIWWMYVGIILAGISINNRSVTRLLFWVFAILLIVNIGGCTIVTPTILQGLQ